MKHHRSIRGGLAFALAGSLITQLVSAAPLPNAWQINDDSASGSLNYRTNLTSAHLIASTNSTGGFQFAVNARFVTEFDSKTMTMTYGLGTRRFLIWFELNGNGDLTAELEGGPTYTITTNGTGTARYHTHEIIYNPTSATASYIVDGQVKTNGWTNSAVSFAAGQVYWGSGSSAGQAAMNFHTVSFSITGGGTVASYDAGTNGNPAIAPDPVTLGWTLSQGAGTTATHVSPDTDMVVVTLPPDQLTNTSARLNGRWNAVGSPTLAWFEWGTDTNYGNVTAAQGVGSGFSVSNLNTVLGGLVGGPDYHYRAVASNAFGVVAGADQFFNISFIQTSTPGLPGVNNSSVAWGDYDNDGRLDFLLLGFATGEYVSQLWRNTGSGFTNVPIAGLAGVVESSVAWGDYDNDGRLDFLLTGQELDGNRISQLWRNTGSGFDNVTFSNLPGAFAGSLAWGDFDNDGRLDFLLTGFNASGQRLTQLWRNEVGGFETFDVPGLTQLLGTARRRGAIMTMTDGWTSCSRDPPQPHGSPNCGGTWAAALPKCSSPVCREFEAVPWRGAITTTMDNWIS